MGFNSGFKVLSALKEGAPPCLSDLEGSALLSYLVALLFLARQPPVGQGLLIHEVSRSHTMTHHSR